MKNKIAKKLFFSAVALGASVLTLTTTTYAWYVQNNTVTATNVQAQTASNEAGSLFISKDARYGVTPTWGPKLEAAETDYTSDDGKARGNAKEAFTPVTYDATNRKFVDVNNADVPANAANPTAPGKVLVYNFWLLSNRSSGVTVQPTLTVVNSTTTKTAQTAYAAINKKVGNNDPAEALVSEGEEFWVDAVQALRMRVQTFTMDNNETIANPNYDDQDPLSTPTLPNPNYHKFTVTSVDAFYDVLEVAKKPKGQNDTVFTPYELATAESPVKSVVETQLGAEQVDGSTLYGAHAYYKRFVGKNATAGWDPKFTATTLDKAGEMNTIEVSDKPQLVTITIWLEGADISCFDSCSGQTFNFGFDFTVAVANS